MIDIVEVMAKAAALDLGDHDSDLSSYESAMRAALAALEQAGYAVVPVVPTEAMIDAGDWNPWEGTSKSFAAIGWEKMIDAYEHPAADTAGPTRPSDQDA